MTDIKDALMLENRLKALTTLQSETQDALHRSLRLQDFEPRDFEHGSCKVGGRGNVEYRPDEAVVTITLGNGEVLEYPMLDVPYDIWPSTMQDEFMRIPSHKRPKLKVLK